jgi:hypothetical protein
MNAIGRQVPITSEDIGVDPNSNGPTAATVNSQQRPIGSQFEFMARGGVGNTIKAGTQNYIKTIEYKNKLKAFEELVQQKEKGAQAAYQEAISSDPELKNWIPSPDLFMDDNTGAFMPLKYYESFNKGYQEYKKDKTQQEENKIAQAKLDATANYQQGQLGIKKQQAETDANYKQGQLGLGQQKIDLAKSALEERENYHNSLKALRSLSVSMQGKKLASDQRDDILFNQAKNRANMTKIQADVGKLEAKIKEAISKGRPQNIGGIIEYTEDPTYAEELRTELEAKKGSLMLLEDTDQLYTGLLKQKGSPEKTNPGVSTPAPEKKSEFTIKKVTLKKNRSLR